MYGSNSGVWYGRLNGSRSQITPFSASAASTAATEVRRPDRDALVRAVVHRHDHRAAGDRVRDLHDGRLARADGEQRHVRPAGLALLPLHDLHDLRQPRAVLLLRPHRPARQQRGEFAGAVPGHRRDRHPKVLQHAEDRLIGEQHAEDGRPEAAQLGLGRGPLLGGRVRRQVQHAAERRLRPPGFGREPVAPRERVFDLREHAAQVREHVRVLRALAGEQQGDRALCGQRLVEVVNAVRVADLLALRVGEALGGAGQPREQVGGRTRDDREPRAAGREFGRERSRELRETEVGLLLDARPRARARGRGVPRGRRRAGRTLRCPTRSRARRYRLEVRSRWKAWSK